MSWGAALYSRGAPDRRRIIGTLTPGRVSEPRNRRPFRAAHKLCAPLLHELFILEGIEGSQLKSSSLYLMLVTLFEFISSEQKKNNNAEKLNPKPPSTKPSKEDAIPFPKSCSAPSKGNSNLNPKSSSTSSKENSIPVPKSCPGALLKLNYDEVLNAWSDRGSPFSEEITGSEISGSDALQARLAQIDLFGETGALREACVQRYKEKRQARLFSKKIRYEVRKVNADQRPRMKGRFVRRPDSSGSEER